MLCETSRSGHLHYFHVLPELVQARAKMLDEDRAVALISPRIIICKTRVAGGLHAVTTRSRLVHCLPVRVKVERRYHWLARAPRKNTITEAWPRRPKRWIARLQAELRCARWMDRLSVCQGLPAALHCHLRCKAPTHYRLALLTCWHPCGNIRTPSVGRETEWFKNYLRSIWRPGNKERPAPAKRTCLTASASRTQRLVVWYDCAIAWQQSALSGAAKIRHHT